jgi:hypothetical protein
MYQIVICKVRTQGLALFVVPGIDLVEGFVLRTLTFSRVKT